MINYQGRLLAKSGDPVPDGSYSIVFTIYDSGIAGNSKWTETQSVNTSGGLFSVLLGSTNPILDTVFSEGTRYLGIRVGGDPELSPRITLASVPFAQHISTIDGAAGGTITSKVSIGLNNSNTGADAFVAGSANHVTGDFATIGGGTSNHASDSWATVQGGRSNEASGRHSFAVGHNASAIHDGSFVWSDGSDVVFASTAEEQFLIQASGGVGINTNAPDVPLHIDGGSDVSLGYGGYLIAGPVDGTNIAMDNNEIMARDNGAASSLYLNTNGGYVLINGSSESRVGIGLTSPTRVLHIKQNSATDPIADAWTIYSSRRWKTDITRLDNALDLVCRLEGVRYRWKRGNKEDIGLIAEDAGKVVPEVVEYESNGIDATSVDYSRLVPLLIESIKEQQAQIEYLSQRIKMLENARVVSRSLPTASLTAGASEGDCHIDP
jgi:hypothetical protein